MLRRNLRLSGLIEPSEYVSQGKCYWVVDHEIKRAALHQIIGVESQARLAECYCPGSRVSVRDCAEMDSPGVLVRVRVTHHLVLRM